MCSSSKTRVRSERGDSSSGVTAGNWQIGRRPGVTSYKSYASETGKPV
jgi:hypothetical protein